MEFFGNVNFLKGALVFSDFITTVSRKYSQEIQTTEFGFGLEGVLRTRSSTVTGILNGVDYDEWSPETDQFIVAHYSPQDFGGKAKCKQDLLATFGMTKADSSLPVIGIVSRFAAQKGFDLITQIMERLAREEMIIVALGSGDKTYEEMFLRLSKQFPQKIAVKIAYDNAVAHKIEAGSDMFLMPSRYEPCGLNQIYSLKYGTVPIVRATGGLDDTIEHWDPRTQRHRLQIHRLQRRSAAANHQGSVASLPGSKFLAATHAQWHEQRFLVECLGQGIHSRLRTRTADAGSAEWKCVLPREMRVWLWFRNTASLTNDGSAEPADSAAADHLRGLNPLRSFLLA